MQNAKDSFYIALRNRLAIVNPERVMSLRGIERPAILMEEAEAPVGEMSNNVFVLRWIATTFVESASLLVKLDCEVCYATCGSAKFSGLDRGRIIADMDRELLSALRPMSTRKMQYTSTPAVALQTYVFWSDAMFRDLVTLRDKLQRVANISVFSFIEPGVL